MSARSTPRQCVQCGIDIRWDGRFWKDDSTSRKCEGYAAGHKPDNKLRKDQIAAISKPV